MMGRYSYILLLFIIYIPLGSCGFRAVYKHKNNEIYSFLQQIEVAPVDTVAGAEFYNQLKNILPPVTRSEYILENDLSFSENPAIIRTNSDVLLESVTVSIHYRLREKKSGKTIFSGSFTRLSSYSSMLSAYTSVVNKQNVLTNLAIMSAEEIRNRIILYIENNKNEILHE